LELETNLAKLFFVEISNQPNVENFSNAQPPLILQPENPTPNNPPWNVLTAIGIWILSILAIIIFPAVFIVPYFLMNRQISLETFQTDPTAIFLSLLAVIPAHIFTLAAAWLVVTKFNKFSFKETLGWDWGGFKWWYFPVIVITFFIFAAIVETFLPEQDNELMRILRSSRSAVYVTALLATFTAPIVEEVIYRGILYSALQRSIGVVWAVTFVTAAFAGVHFLQYWGSPGTIVLICILSLILTLIRVRTKNLLPCIVLHFIFNGIQSLVLILQPFLPENLGGVQEQVTSVIHFFK
jgi:membrane protease YdiL (CAAX protease family)